MLQRVIEVSPTDVDPVNGPVSSTFNAGQFQQVWQALNNTPFRTAMNARPAARQRFTFANLDPILVAQPDIPTLAAAMITAASANVAGAQAALMPHRGDLERALGTFAHTNAGAGDIDHFRTLFGIGGVLPSRAKGVPSTMTKLALSGGHAGTDNALNHLIAGLQARNNALNTVDRYTNGTWTALFRASEGMGEIRSPHQNGAGWLLNFTAAAAVGLETTLLAAYNTAGVNLQGEGRARRVAMGDALVTAATAPGADASSVERAVETSGDDGLVQYFFRSVFWPATATRANRVLLAWSRYANESGTVANCPYIEFAGGGLASRFIWDYVHDRFYLSAHYNWVDGYNPFFQILGTAATF